MLTFLEKRWSIKFSEWNNISKENILMLDFMKAEEETEKTHQDIQIKLPLTAVTRNGEKCAKFTFFFRKKYYLSGKYSVPKFATSCSRETLAVSLPRERERENRKLWN